MFFVVKGVNVETSGYLDSEAPASSAVMKKGEFEKTSLHNKPRFLVTD